MDRGPRTTDYVTETTISHQKRLPCNLTNGLRERGDDFTLQIIMLLMRCRYISILLFVIVTPHITFAQLKNESSNTYRHKLPDSLYIIKYDSLLHLQSSIFANNMEYHLKYTKDFELRLSPNNI